MSRNSTQLDRYITPRIENTRESLPRSGGKYPFPKYIDRAATIRERPAQIRYMYARPFFTKDDIFC